MLSVTINHYTITVLIALAACTSSCDDAYDYKAESRDFADLCRVARDYLNAHEQFPPSDEFLPELRKWSRASNIHEGIDWNLLIEKGALVEGRNLIFRFENERRTVFFRSTSSDADEPAGPEDLTAVIRI